MKNNIYPINSTKNFTNRHHYIFMTNIMIYNKAFSANIAYAFVAV